MKRTFQAVFENGTLRPLEPVNLAEKQQLIVTVSDEGAVARSRLSTRPYNTRSVEQKWIKDHASEYVDQWVVVEGDRLISHGMDAIAVCEEARAAGVTSPFLTHVSMPDDLPWGGW